MITVRRKALRTPRTRFSPWRGQRDVPSALIGTRRKRQRPEPYLYERSAQIVASIPVEQAVMSEIYYATHE